MTWMSPRLPGDGEGITRSAQRSAYPAADRIAEAHGLATPVERLVALARDPLTSVRCAVAVNPATPPAALILLISDPDDAIRVVVARRLRLGEEFVQVLAVDPSVAVRSAIADRRDLPVEVAAMLAADRAWQVRRSSAGNPRTPYELLVTLARDRRGEVRLAAYANPVSTPEVRDRVAAAPPDRVREVAAGSLLAAPEELRLLAGDRSRRVRAEVARNDATPLDVIGQLIHDRDGTVRAVAAVRGVEAGLLSAADAAPVLLLSRAPRRVLVEALETTTASALVDLALAVGHREYLLAAAAARCATYAQLHRLAATDDPAVLRRLVNSPAAPADLLDELSHRESDVISPPRGESPPGVVGMRNGVSFCYEIAVACHPNTGEDTLTRLMREGLPSTRRCLVRRGVPSMLLFLAGDAEVGVRAEVAAFLGTPRVILEELAHDESSMVRAAVHANPNASPQARATAEGLGLHDIPPADR